MKLVCLEGPHGIGKTTLCNRLSGKGYNVLRENFIPDGDTLAPPLHPRSFAHELIWITSWMQGVLDHLAAGDGLLFSDRSPLSTHIYDEKNSILLEGIATNVFADLTLVGVEIVFVKLELDVEHVWSRVRERLLHEPLRELLDEGSRDWLQAIVEKYSVIDLPCVKLTPETTVDEEIEMVRRLTAC